MSECAKRERRLSLGFNEGSSSRRTLAPRRRRSSSARSRSSALAELRAGLDRGGSRQRAARDRAPASDAAAATRRHAGGGARRARAPRLAARAATDDRARSTIALSMSVAEPRRVLADGRGAAHAATRPCADHGGAAARVARRADRRAARRRATAGRRAATARRCGAPAAAEPAAPPDAGGHGPAHPATAAPGTGAPTAAGRQGARRHDAACAQFEPKASSSSRATGDYVVNFNLEDADLPELVQAPSAASPGKRFIFGGKVRSIKATVYSPREGHRRPRRTRRSSRSSRRTGMTVIPHGRFLKIVETAGVVDAGDADLRRRPAPCPTRIATSRASTASRTSTPTRSRHVLGKFKTQGRRHHRLRAGQPAHHHRHRREHPPHDAHPRGDRRRRRGRADLGRADPLRDRPPSIATALNELFDLKGGGAPAARRRARAAARRRAAAAAARDARSSPTIARNSLIIVATERATCASSSSSSASTSRRRARARSTSCRSSTRTARSSRRR